MSRGLRLVPALAAALVGVLTGVAAQSIVVATVLPALALATILVPRTYAARGPAQVALAVVAVALGTFLAFAITPEEATWYSGRLMLLFCAIALSMALATIPRLLIEAPFGGYSATAGLGLVAVLAASTADSGPLFPILGAVWIVVQLAAMARAAPSRLGWRELTGRHRALLVVGATVAAVVTVAFALVLPPAYDWGIRHFGLRFWEARTGFSTRMGLGSLDGMLQSDEPILRIYGPRPDYLRGVVFSTYARGRWTRSRRVVVAGTTTARPGERGDEDVEIWSIGGRRRRYFVPLDARDVRLPDGVGRVDSTGLFFPVAGELAEVISFTAGPREAHRPLEPGAEDLDVDESIRGDLRRISESWVPDGVSPEKTLEAHLARFAEDFEYALKIRRRPRTDPVLDFLDRRTGHCEYFASALALLARTRGIPTRVVAGYRVTEYNQIGDYHLVRERNAHAWVEAWIEGRGWTTWDPTPPSELASYMAARTPFVSALADHLSSLARRALYGVASLDPWTLAATGVALLLLWLMVRWIQGRRRRDAPGSAGAQLAYEDPRPLLVALLESLERRGVRRSAHETLERFAERLEEAGGDERRAAALLRRYAAWRYGGHGEPDALDAEIESYLGR